MFCRDVPFACVILIASGFSFAAEGHRRNLATLERSYWLHASLAPSARRGYWGAEFHECDPPSAQEIRNATERLTGTYGANRLYLIYHHEIPIEAAERIFALWRGACPKDVEVVPALLLRMYDKPQSPVFATDELRRLIEFFKDSINASTMAIYDVNANREQGSGMDYLAGQYPGGLIRLGIQPDEKLAYPVRSAVQDTWSGFCHGKTNADWLDHGFGADVLRKWVADRNHEKGRVVWDLIAVAWDYTVTPRGGYPGYDDARKNMPLPAGRNTLAAQEILRVAQGDQLGGFSSDLLILQANSQDPAHDGRDESFYQVLKRGQRYGGYYSKPLDEIADIFQRLKKGEAPG